jgi:Flp pilus assembly protein TadG
MQVTTKAPVKAPALIAAVGWAHTADRLRRDRSGLALMEFALGLPLVLSLALYGVETANLALANLRVSQIALNLADNASRVGIASTLNTVQLREVDMNDVLQASRIQGAKINLSKYGRVIVSSLENPSGTQRIHWQRCFGLMKGANYDSSYGTTKITDGTDGTTANQGTDVSTGMGTDAGMGDSGARVTSPLNSGVMFVEVNYQYQPIAPNWLTGPKRLHYIASFIVRDSRDFTQIYNPSPTAVKSTCDKYTV